MKPNEDEIPIQRWTRQGYLERNFKGVVPENFYFKPQEEPFPPIVLHLGEMNYKFEDFQWENIGTDEHAVKTKLTPEEKEQLEEENARLEKEINFLLDLNTKYELKKAKLRDELDSLEQQIRSFPGLDEDSF